MVTPEQAALYTVEAHTFAYTREGALIVRSELARLFRDLHARGITPRGFSIGTGYKENSPVNAESPPHPEG